MVFKLRDYAKILFSVILPLISFIKLNGALHLGYQSSHSFGLWTWMSVELSLCLSECFQLNSCLIKPNQVISCVLVNYGTFS